MSGGVDPRRVATIAGAAAGAAAGLGAAGVSLLAAQAWRARQEIGPRTTVPPYADGRYGPRTGTSLRLVVLGDSGAASLGADHPDETIGAILAAGVAAASGRGVVLANMAVVGARSRDLAVQVDRALVIRPHVVFVMIGGNDVTHLRGSRRPARELGEAVARLCAAGCEVVVGTCPDLGTVRPLGPPLRDLARRLSRELAAAQTVAVVEAGGRSVSLADLLGAEFEASPETLFSADRFHPSAAGYAAVAGAVLPSVLAALGLGPADGPLAITSGPALPVPMAAQRAAGEAGTEVSRASQDVPTGAVTGVRGRLVTLAELRRRIHLPLPLVRTPADADDADAADTDTDTDTDTGAGAEAGAHPEGGAPAAAGS